MGVYFPFIAGVLAALSLVLLVWGARLARADKVDTGYGTGAKVKQERPFILTQIAEVIGRPFGRMFLQTIGDKGRASARRRLNAAGQSGKMSLEQYGNRRAGEIVFYGALGLLTVTSINVLIGLVVILVGVALTDAQLIMDSRMRQDQLQRQLPDFLDVLAVTVTAGLGFRSALARVAESMPGPLAEEFQTALRQMELGTPRRAAFEELRARNSSKAIGQFVTALLQAEELGAPLTQALLDISIDMRRESAQWAKRKAQKINPRITAVTAGAILPGLMIVILGSVYYGLGANFGSVFGG